MGWEKGKGLGVNQQGDTEIIKVRHKDDSKGVGFKGHDDTWIAHQDDFAAVLADLNKAHDEGAAKDATEEGKESSGSDGETNAGEKSSLESASKTRRKRVQ